MGHSFYLRGAQIIDGTGRDPIEHGTILIENGRISEVGGPELPLQPGVEVADVTGQTIMPGMVDCHFHGIYRDASSHEDYDFRRSPEESMIVAALNAQIILEGGFTTARDVGTRGLTAVTLRNMIDAGILTGPRIRAGGPIITSTGGLSDHYGYWGCNHNALGRIADGAQEITLAVREQIKYGVNNVKLEASGTGISTYSHSTKQTTPEEDLRAAVIEAHRNGVRVACHAQGNASIKNAVRAGVDTIEHGSFLDEESISLMKSHGTVLVPTLSVMYLYVNKGPEVGVPVWAVDKFRGDLDAHIESFRLAHSSGVPIALGSDSGHAFNPQEMIAFELELMVRFGMSPMEALVAATATGAAAVGLGDQVGRLLPGMQADLLVVDGAPLSDVRILQQRERLTAVYKGGELLAGTKARRESAGVKINTSAAPALTGR